MFILRFVAVYQWSVQHSAVDTMLCYICLQFLNAMNLIYGFSLYSFWLTPQITGSQKFSIFICRAHKITLVG